MAKSRNEAALENILGANNELLPPVSRNEKWLHKILGEEIETDPIQSRIEQLLHDIAEQGIGGEQPTLFAPVVTGGINEISWANNPDNGAFEVTLTADVDGTPVTSPLTITEQMDGSTLTITASATNFEDNVVTIDLVYTAPSSNTKLFVTGTLAGNLAIRIGDVDATNPQYYNDVAYGGTLHPYASWIYNPPIDGTDIPWQIGASSIGTIAFRYTSNTRNEFIYNVNAQDITGTPNIQASISYYDENNNLIITKTPDQWGYIVTPTSAQGGTLKMHMVINLEITG